MRAITRVGLFIVGASWVLCSGGAAFAQSNTCAGATSVGGGGTFNGTTAGATNDAGALCSSSATSPDVWYKFTAGCAGTLQVNTCGSTNIGGPGLGIDTVLSLHSACPGTAGNMLACNDQTNLCTGAFINDSAVSTVVAAGATVLIRVSTWTTTAAGAFILNVSFIPDGVPGSLGNGDFASGGTDWCFFDESNSGSVSYATGAAVVTGGNLLESNRFTYIQQVFTTYDSANHSIGFDWSYSTTNAPNWDSARWDLIDQATGLSVVSGPLTLGGTSGSSGAVTQGFTGSGVYLLRLGTFTVDGAAGAGVSTFDNILITCDSPVDRFSNGDFALGNAAWCFTDESQSGSVSYSSGAAVVTGGNDLGSNRLTYLQQTFTTFDAADHTITFDWSYSTTNIPTYDQARWDLIDLGSGLSVVGGPVILADANGGAGVVSASFGGSGQYALRLGTFTGDGAGGAGVSTFDNISIGCDSAPGPLDNGDFGDTSGGRWCFTDESISGSVDFSSGAAVVVGGNDGGDLLTTSIRQTFTTYDVASHTITFDWSYASTNSAGFDEARWDLIDEGTGLSLVAGPVILTETPGTSGAVSQSFTGSGVYTLVLATWTQDGIFGPGVTSFDNVSISCDAVPGHFLNGDFAAGSQAWCFTDESNSGSADFTTGAAVVTGGDDGGSNLFTSIRQAFTTYDVASHVLTFDWSYLTTNSPTFDEARWDLIDLGTGLSLVGGPLTLADSSGGSGTVIQSFSGTGNYSLVLGTWTDDACCGAGVSTFDNVSIACDSVPGRFSNGDFAAGSASWCFTDEGTSGSVDFTTGAAVVTGGNNFESGSFTYIQQAFTTSDAATHTITLDWSYTTTNVDPFFDQVRADIIDESTGLSVISGPVTISGTSGTSGTFSQDFSGSGVYSLQLGTWTSDGAFGPGVSTFDNVSIACAGVSGPFSNGNFGDPSGAPWCFTPEGPGGSVDFSGGAAVVTGGDIPLGAGAYDTFISQTFDASPGAVYDISFGWSYFSTNVAPYDGGYWDLIDVGTGLTVVGGPVVLSDTTGSSGTATASFSGTGTFTLILGTYTVDSVFGPGVTTFDDVTITPQACNAVSGLVCDVTGPTTNLTWTNNDAYAEVRVYRDNVLIATLPGSAVSHSDAGVPVGPHDYEVVGDCGVVDAPAATCSITIVPPPPNFRRGDSNNDGGINIADAIHLLAFLFPAGGPPSVLVCLDASDANDDDVINIADAISVLAALFGAPTTPLPAPYPACGIDPTPGVMRCATTVCP